jgi:hypothetical protein
MVVDAVANEGASIDDAIESLQNLNLINRDDEILSLHRLVQSGYLYDSICDRQTAFEHASLVICHIFPKQIKGRWLFGEWAQCQANVKHVLALAQCYETLKKEKLEVKPCNDFVNVLLNCAW